jgi:hypothetical protein
MPSETTDKIRKDTKALQQKILRKILTPSQIGEISEVDTWTGPTTSGWRNPYHVFKVLYIFGFMKGIYALSKQFQYPKVSLSMLDEIDLVLTEG